eukprot:TRINITY_DN43375_c0_g1_i1.p1 TRINITY_DN43375_c0_g1~~TRINITY_DN43375_c0_g1_i1.p1  ORF type:complete len:332 (+),score=160.40 TRINITY_DN43375_c0_g1_i1:42-1037(+)
MNIQVKSSDATTAVSAESSWTVLQLKGAIEKQLKVAATAQKLTVGGKIMKNDKLLSDYPAAAQQAVSLVVSGGAAPAASTANKSEDRKQVDGLVMEVIGIIKQNKEAQALYDKYGNDVPDTKDLQEALGVDGFDSVKEKVLNELTEVLDGNWTAFDQYHKPLREFAFKMLETREVTVEKRDAWVEKAASMGLEKFAEYPDVQENIAKETKPGRDLVKELLPVAKKCARRAIDLFLDGANPALTGHDSFSQQLRLLVVTTVGALMDGIIDVLKDGQPQCQQLMAKVTGMIIEKLGERMPEYSTLFAFAGPMAMNQLIQWHEEFLKDIKGKTF